MSLIPYMVRRIAVAAKAASASLSSAILSEPGLIHYWPITELSGGTLDDLIGGKDFTITNATLSSDGAYFNGTNAKGQTALIDMSARQKLVVEMVVKWDSFANDNDVTLEFGVSNSVGGFVFLTNDSNSKTMNSILVGNVGTNFGYFARPSTGWHHIVLIYDYTRTGKEVAVYVDGKKIAWAGGSASNNTGYFGNWMLNLSCRNGSSLFREQIVKPMAIYSDLSEARIIEHARITGLGMVEYPVNNSQLLDNIYSATDNPRQSIFARYVFDTAADVIGIKGTTDAVPYYPQISVNVNGVALSTWTFSENGQWHTFVTLGSAGTTKRVELVVGTQTIAGFSYPHGTYLDSVSCNSGYSISTVSETPTNRMFIYGDSITSGVAAINTPIEGWAPLLRTAYNREVIVEAWALRSLHDDASTQAKIDALTAKIVAANPVTVYLAIGVNDYGAPKWSAANFGTAYAALLDAIHAALPDVMVVCQSPIVRTSEVANSYGDTLQAYRDQISAVAAARSEWAIYYDGTTILALSDLSGGDGTHPPTAGHPKYALAVDTFLDGEGL